MGLLFQSKRGHLPSHNASKLHLIFLKAISKVLWPAATLLNEACTQNSKNIVNCERPLTSKEVQVQMSIILDQDLPTPMAGVPSPCKESGTHLR